MLLGEFIENGQNPSFPSFFTPTYKTVWYKNEATCISGKLDQGASEYRSWRCVIMSPSRNNYCPECGTSQDQYLSVESTAKMFDLSVAGIRSLIKRREIPFYKLGSRIRISYREFESQLIRYPSIREVGLESDMGPPKGDNNGSNTAYQAPNLQEAT